MRNGAQAPDKSDALVAAYWTMIFAWMLDFRAEDAGAGIAAQSALLAIYLLGLIRYMIVSDGMKLNVPGLTPVVYCTNLFLFVSVASGLAYGQDPYLIFRHVLTLVIYNISIVSTARVVLHVDQGGLRRLRGTFAKMALGYAVMNLLIVQFFGGGIDLSSTRYEILSAATIPMNSYGIAFIVFDIFIIETIDVILSLIMVFYSVTRTIPILIVAQLASMSLAIVQFFSARMVLTGFAVLSIGLAFAFSNGSGFDRWTQRLFEGRDASGVDYSAYTRLTENQFMLDHFLDSPATILFGNGLAHETTWFNVSKLNVAGEHSTGYGHDQHVSLLFVAGLVGGLPLVIVHFQQLIAALRTTVSLSRRRWGRNDHLEFLTLWGALIVVAFVVYDFSAAAFGNRGWSLWYGVGTGLLLGGRACLQRRAAAMPTQAH